MPPPEISEQKVSRAFATLCRVYGQRQGLVVKPYTSTEYGVPRSVLYHLPVVALAVMAVAVRAQPSVSVTLNDGSAPLEVDCQPLRGGVESLSMWNTLVTESSSDHPKYETCQNEKIQRPELQV